MPLKRLSSPVCTFLLRITKLVILDSTVIILNQLSQWVYWKRRARTRGHGQTDTDRRTRGHERRTVMEKTGTYGKDGQLWKRRTVMEKTDTYGKDGHLWKRRAIMEKTGIKFLKARFLVERLTPRTTSITHIVNKIQNTILTGI